MKVKTTEYNRVMAERIGLKEHTCTVCGKTFECRPEHIYKKKKPSGYEYYCTLTCLRKAEKAG